MHKLSKEKAQEEEKERVQPPTLRQTTKETEKEVKVTEKEVQTRDHLHQPDLHLLHPLSHNHTHGEKHCQQIGHGTGVVIVGNTDTTTNTTITLVQHAKTEPLGQQARMIG